MRSFDFFVLPSEVLLPTQLDSTRFHLSMVALDALVDCTCRVDKFMSRLQRGRVFD